MKILIVDNGTHYKKRLANLLNGHETTWIAYQKLTPKLYRQSFDLIVLTGAYKTYSVKAHGSSVYAKELDLIRSARVPVIGICLGAQLIAYLYGARLSEVQGGKIKGIKRIWNVKRTPFVFRYFGGRVWASQRWCITELPDELECWCASQHGAEVFRHRTKPIWGLQFHPERLAEKNDGHRIFETIIEIEYGKRNLARAKIKVA